MKDKHIEAFLKDLDSLTAKHGILIGGCGCCGSPFLLNVNGKVIEYRLIAEELLYDINELRYTVKDAPESGNFEYDGEFYVYS